MKHCLKKVQILLCIVSLVLISFAGLTPQVHAFGGGDGSPGDPYQIASWSDLNDVRNNLSASYILMADLDENSAGYSTYAGSSANTGSGWQPISDNSSQFAGSLDGADHTLTGMVISRSATNYVGLFGYLSSSATVSNLTIKNPVFDGASNVGGVTGFNGGSITRVHIVNPSLTSAANSVGGISGLGNGNITLSSVKDGTVSTPTTWAGGISGWQSGGTISRSWSSANVSGKNDVGGLVGHAGAATISNSYATGNVTTPANSENSFGGIAGVAGTITNSYATGNVTITGPGYNSGGLFGEGGNVIQNDFAVGTVSAGIAPFGGFAGYNQTSLANSYSVTGTPVGSGATSGVSDVADGSVFQGLTHTHAVYNNAGNEWDFSTIWEAHDGAYPTLLDNADVPPYPTILISSPVDSAKINSWSPAVDWGDSDTCQFSWNNTDWSTVDCGGLGADIPAPSEGNAITLYVRGELAGGAGFATVTHTFDYDLTAPAVDAGSNQQTNASFSQSEAAASDAGSGIASYAWTKQTGSGTVSFTDASVLKPTISAISQDGSYVLRLTVVDEAGNSAYDDFTLIWDTTNPSITLDSFPDLITNQTSAGFVFQATDALSLPISFSCKLDSGSFNSCASQKNFTGLVEGSHTVTVRARDAAGNNVETSPYTWTIDTTPPVITRTGSESISLIQGQSYSDAGATAADALSGDLTGSIAIVNPVNTAIPDTYIVKYNVVDQAGNAAVEVVRTVHILSNVDLDGDSTADASQDNVTSINYPTTGYEVVAKVDASCSLSNVSVKNQATLARDDEFSYPLGLLDFNANCGTPGYTTTVTQYYYNAPAGNYVLRKFNHGSFQTVPDALFERRVIGGSSVLVISYQVTDGGQLDVDGIANGIIVDPAGPAVLSEAAAPAQSTGLPLPATGSPVTLGALLGGILLLLGFSLNLYKRSS